MYTQVAYALAVNFGTDSISQAVNVAGANAVSVDATVISQTSTGTLTIALEGSNDLANWKTIVPSMIATSGSAIGYNTGQYPATTATATERIGYEYVRLRYVQGTAGPSIVSACINVFEA